MDFVRPFEALCRQDVGLAGGKGANLGEMVQAGLPVPPGFVLLTPAYDAFVAANDLQAKIERLAGAVRPDLPATAEEASARIRDLFAEGSMPPEVVRPLLDAYARLGGGLVAVRSSATAEDLPGASFAGQQESYLNIQGGPELSDAVKRCWSSLWTARAMVYRARQGIEPAAVALAVVVQRQIGAESAGVLFTADPVSGRRDQMVIDGAWGLGEAVVSGQVTPDHWLARGDTGETLEAQVADKAVMTVRIGSATALTPVPAEMRHRPVLDRAEVAALVELGRQVAAHFGSPQDIEWARADGRFWLVQSRPITSLFPLPEPADPSGRYRVFLCFNILQGLVEPFTPMGLAFFRSLARGPAGIFGIRLGPGADVPAYRTAAGRAYIDVTAALESRKTRKAITTLPAAVDRPSAEILRELADREPRLRPVAAGLPVRPPLGLVLTLLFTALSSLMAPDRARRKAVAAVEGRLAALEQQSARLQTLEERRRFLWEQPGRLFLTVVRTLAPLLFPGVGAGILARRKVGAWLGDVSLLNPVLRSLPHNPTTEMDIALWQVSRQLKAAGEQPTREHPAVRRFLEQYGHRAVREIDVGMVRWREDPTHILGVLATYLKHGAEEDPAVQFRRGAAEAEEAAKALVSRVARERGRMRAGLLRFLISRGRALAGMREYPKFYVVKAIALFRQVLTDIGEELVAQGHLDRAEDVFFLDLRDLDQPESLRAKAAANRAEYGRELARRAVPRVLTSDGEALYTPPAAAEGGLTGTPASPGLYEGTVRVVQNPEGAVLEPGEVLVAPGTDPAWTPLFLSAGALVMEVGGMMSHGSVVAREYGIPAVVGVADATRLLRTGQRVRVDGETGVVLPLD